MLWWIGQHLVIAGLLAGVVATMCRVGRLGPAGRHALWVIVLLKLLTPPLLVLPSPWSMPDRVTPRSPDGPMTALEVRSSRSSGLTAPEAVAPSAPPLTPARIVTPRRSSVTALEMAAGLWVAGGLAFVLLQGVRITRLALRVRRSGVDADPGLTQRVETLARRLRMAPIRTRVVVGLTSPLVWCVRSPELLWPATLPSGLSEACLDGLVVHELAHVKRRDHWVGWLELAAGAVWWWNPLVWYVRSQVREHAELSCDAWVIDAVPNGRRAYAEGLVSICDTSRQPVPVPAVGVSTGSRRVLERRLAMIMRGHVSSRLPRIGFVIIALLATAALPAWAQRQSGALPPVLPVKVDVLPVVQQVPAQPVPVQSVPVTVVPVEPGQRITESPRELFAYVAQAPLNQALPADARKLIDGLYAQQAEAQREADARIAKQREDVIKQLQAIQDTLTKAGRLDEAVAVRDCIRQLQSDAAGRLLHTTPFWSFNRTLRVDAPPVETMPHLVSQRTRLPELRALFNDATPFSVAVLRGQAGATLTIEVVGAAGQVWGTDVYTDDSSIAAAAVHAGLLKVGERGLVKVTILPGQDGYAASERNGVKSEAFGAFAGSFRIERAK
jgi:beta-lactamase regulating signal transducer with metallopeptidase domain